MGILQRDVDERFSGIRMPLVRIRRGIQCYCKEACESNVICFFEEKEKAIGLFLTKDRKYGNILCRRQMKDTISCAIIWENKERETKNL